VDFAFATAECFVVISKDEAVAAVLLAMREREYICLSIYKVFYLIAVISFSICSRSGLLSVCVLRILIHCLEIHWKMHIFKEEKIYLFMEDNCDLVILFCFFQT
jgi:hypothetical protein